MKTLRLTKKDFKDTNNYWKEYIGKEDVSNYDGNIEIESNLGYVRFSGNLIANGNIIAKVGSSIKAGGGIKAGWGIKAGSSIKAGDGIKAGWGIEAGGGIEAGDGIEAGGGIEAGLSIICKSSLNIGKRIFAGLSVWKSKEEITKEDKTISCGKLENGDVEYGILKELGMPDEKKASLSGKIVKVELDGISYEAVIK